MNNLGWPLSFPIHCCSVYLLISVCCWNVNTYFYKKKISYEGLLSFFILFPRLQGQHSFLLVELIVALCILVNMWGMKLWCCVQKNMQACLLQTPPSWQEVRHGKRVLKEDQVFSVAFIGFNLHPPPPMQANYRQSLYLQHKGKNNKERGKGDGHYHCVSWRRDCLNLIRAIKCCPLS